MALGGKILTWYAGQWQHGNTPILSAADHATWQGTLVFDGARAFDGLAPDLDLHCARIIRSAEIMGLTPPKSAAQIEQLIRDGIAQMDPDTPLYLRPMIWSRDGSPSIIDPDPSSTDMAICIEGLPMPAPADFALTLSPFRRPHPDTALNAAKAACLYPNNGRIVAEARKRGFNNALSCDLDGNVAETASTNVFMLRDGEYLTPVPNGTFLNGITRQRIIALLRAAGQTVTETSLRPADFDTADEIFLTGNANKVTPVTRYESRHLPTIQGWRVRDLYMDYARSTGPTP